MDDAEPKMMEPTVDSDGYLSGPAPGDAARIAATAAALPGSLAALWQRTKDTGAIPAHPDLVAQGINQTRLEQIAAHKQGRRQANGAYGAYRFWVSGSDPLFTYALDDGSAVVCRAVRETVRYTSPPGTLMVQRTAYQSWGYPLGPGSYPRLTTTGAWQTCWVTTAFPGQPSFLIDTEGMGGSTVAG
jgi:hypothetical protein